MNNLSTWDIISYKQLQWFFLGPIDTTQLTFNKYRVSLIRRCLFLANKCEESCTIYIFKSLLVENPEITLDEDETKQAASEETENSDNHIELYLLGYGKIKYFNDGYYRLCNYLIKSVYDQNALEPESFDIKQFIFDSYSPSFGKQPLYQYKNHAQFKMVF